MADQDRERLRQWVENWRSAGEVMARLRVAEIQASDTRRAVEELFGPWDVAEWMPRRLSSGLVEQQAWFARLRK
jgi:hypothetical protein